MTTAYFFRGAHENMIFHDGKYALCTCVDEYVIFTGCICKYALDRGIFINIILQDVTKYANMMVVEVYCK